MNFVKILKKEKNHYSGKVYDLCVENSHSYNINNLVVHNSGAGSLVNYALGITKVDPLEYDLIFERFLNPDRGHLVRGYLILILTFVLKKVRLYLNI